MRRWTSPASVRHWQSVLPFLFLLFLSSFFYGSQFSDDTAVCATVLVNKERGAQSIAFEHTKHAVLQNEAPGQGSSRFKFETCCATEDRPCLERRWRWLSGSGSRAQDLQIGHSTCTGRPSSDTVLTHAPNGPPGPQRPRPTMRRGTVSTAKEEEYQVGTACTVPSASIWHRIVRVTPSLAVSSSDSLHSSRHTQANRRGKP